MFKRIGRTKYLALPTYEHHKRSKNWVAAIEGLDPKYKFNRRFIKIHTVDNIKAIEETEVLNLKYIQFYSMYFTGSGKEHWDEEKKSGTATGE